MTRSLYWSVPPEWAGETVFLLAGGPSLRGFPSILLKGKGRTLAINNSYLIAPWADALYFCDAKWWRVHQSKVAEVFKGHYLITAADSREFPDHGIKHVRTTNMDGLERDPSCVCHGKNGGYQAINLAYHFGARQIVLLGYDMNVSLERTHWHHGHRDTPNARSMEVLLRTKMLPHFQSLVKPLQEAGVEVVNCTPGSRITCWPRVNLKDVLADLGYRSGCQQKEKECRR